MPAQIDSQAVNARRVHRAYDMQIAPGVLSEAMDNHHSCLGSIRGVPPKEQLYTLRRVGKPVLDRGLIHTKAFKVEPSVSPSMKARTMSR